MKTTERLTNKKAGVDGCYGIIKRAYLNPAAHLYSYNTFRRFFYPSEGWVHPWNPHPYQRTKKPRKKHGMQAPLKGGVIRVITLISPENGVMNNPPCGINHRLNLQGLVAAFTALPGGYRNNNGNYNNMGNNGYFWSSTENNSNNAWNRKLNYNNSDVNRNNNNKQNGFSVRVVRYLNPVESTAGGTPEELFHGVNSFCQSFNHTLESKVQSRCCSDVHPGGQALHKTGGQALHKTGGQALHKTGGQALQRTGGQALQRTGGQTTVGKEASSNPRIHSWGYKRRRKENRFNGL